MGRMVWRNQARRSSLPNSYFSARMEVAGKETGAVAYLDDIHLCILDPISTIGDIESVRIIGTTQEYAHAFVTQLWGDDMPLEVDVSRFCRYTFPSNLYPFTPGQESCVDYGVRAPCGEARQAYRRPSEMG